MPLKRKFPVIEEFSTSQTSGANILTCLGETGPAFLWEGSQTRAPANTSVRHLPASTCYIVVRPKKVIRVQDNTVFVSDNGQTRCTPLAEFGNDPLSALEFEFNRSRPQECAFSGPFSGGAVGFLSYDAARYFEQIKGLEPKTREPDLFFMFTDIVIILDRDQGRLQLVAVPDDSETESECRVRVLAFKAELEDKLDKLVSVVTTPSGAASILKQRFSAEEFMSMVTQAKEYICAGDIFQAVLANQLTLPPVSAPEALFERLCQANASPYHFFCRFGEHTLVGASPETMLRGSSVMLDGQSEPVTRILMRLVAGTYPAGATPNSSNIQALAADEKERAEHMMLVDHARNDIGRVSRTGTVKPTDLLSVESYANVHHLVSQVSGILRPGETVFSAMRSCFPIATLTGTPKIRAMEIIAELEGPSRGVYGGAVGVFGYDGSVDSSVVIRSVVTSPKETTLRVGCGIVYDSIPSREYEECLWKGQWIIDAL